jgi:hypothetical protein
MTIISTGDMKYNYLKAKARIFKLPFEELCSMFHDLNFVQTQSVLNEWAEMTKRAEQILS